MKLTERSFDSQRLEAGTYTMRVENPKYDGERNNISIRAVVVGGEFDGQWILDYYNLARANGDARPNFGVTKIAVLLNAIGIEPDNDFEDREAMDTYILGMESKLQDKAGIAGLLGKIEGKMFVGTVKENGKYTNIVKYAPLSAKAEQAGKGAKAVETGWSA